MFLAAQSAGPNAAVIAIVWVLVIVAYWVPTIVAVARKAPNRGSVAVINGFLGWTFVGWVVALAMACRSVPEPAGPYGY